MLIFLAPLDRAMLDHALILLNPQGRKVAGRASIGEGSMRWEFTPAADWAAGTYQFGIDPELEDLAGNSVARAFEVDVEGPVEAKADEHRVRLPIKIKAAQRL